MQLPFTSEEFFGVFRDYNESLWPAQVFLVGLALAAIVLVLKPRPWSGVGVSAILAILWAWLALVYHLAFFTRINPLAYVFSGLSLAGALGFLWQGVVQRRLQFAWVGGSRAVIGPVLVAYALVFYPIWSWYEGHSYPHMPTFGLPCPTTIFTIGLLAFLAPPYPRTPLIVPIVWSLVGAQAAFLLGVHQDLGLIAAAAVGVMLLVRSTGPAASASAVS